MNPAAFTLKNNRTVLVIYAVAMLLGIQTFNTIGRLEMPEFTIRNAQVITTYAGRTAVQVEEEVTEPIEQAIRQMAEVSKITSTSKPGISIVSVELEEKYFDLEDIWSDMRNRVSETRLPDGAGKPKINDAVGEVFPYVYALSSDGFSYAEMNDFADDIRDDLLEIDGVAKVEIWGEQEERVYMEFSSPQMAAYGASPMQAGQRIANQNAIATSGQALVGKERINLVTSGEFDSLDDLRNYRLTTEGEASSLRVSDLFDITRDYKSPASSKSHFNGGEVVTISISMVPGRAVTEVGYRIDEKIGRIKNELPIGLEIDTMFFQPTYVEKSINDFLINLGQAFFFVVVVMLMFAGWRIAAIVGLLVPSAILMCFVFMPAFGVQLEMMSIAALIIALGLLVDNAVVVSEQILVRLGEGEDRKQAVIGATKNLMIPLLAASGTTIAAFSPIALAEGATSEFTYSLFAVVSITLLCSWLLSLTIIPLFCFYFLRPLKRDTLVGRGLNRLYNPYEKLLRLTLKLKWVYPILILALTIVAAWGFKFIPNIFFPPNDRGQFVIDFELPLGIDISETENRVTKFEEWLLTEHAEEIESVSSWIGNSGPRWYLALSSEPANPNYAFLSVLTHSPDPREVKALTKEINDHAIETYPSARINAKLLENGPAVGDPIQIKLFGREMETLYQLRDKLVSEIKQVDGMNDVRDDWGAWSKQISVDPDPVRTSRLGLTTSDISSALNLQFTGSTITTYREGDKAIPVVLRSKSDLRDHPERLPDVPIFTNGGVVPLGQIADTRVEFLPGTVLREDALRMMTIRAKVSGRFASGALADLVPRISALTESDEWPEGYRIEYAGEQAESAESSGKIGAAMPISMAILALILISQFNSLRRFGIIMLTIPPMLIGVVPGLLITGSSFGFMTLLGIIALLGIIVNNAILLIDEMDSQLKDKSLIEAIVEASKSRLRPIIMTTVTTVIGLAPLAISGGGMWTSLAYAMMFGLGFATVLTLLLCPVLFYLFFRRKYAA